MGYMNDEKITKRLFVENELSAMLHRATRGCVQECWYSFEGAVEHVEFVYKPDSRNAEIIAVDVTADSLWAIAKDVMKAVAERYE